MRFRIELTENGFILLDRKTRKIIQEGPLHKIEETMDLIDQVKK